MMNSKDSSTFPSQFQQEGLKLIESFIELKSSAFYLIAPNMSHKGVVTHNLSREDDKTYQNRYMQLDPLNPNLYERSGERVLHMDSIMSPQFVLQSAYYQDFLKPLGYRYCTDMFFRHEGKIIAVITMLRDESQGEFTTAELELLKNLQPFMEYSLNTVYLPERMAQRKTIGERFQLTYRELDVLELVISGANNKVIANELTLGLPTVKTHLQHIYHKASVSSRTELLSRIIADEKVSG